MHELEALPFPQDAEDAEQEVAAEMVEDEDEGEVEEIEDAQGEEMSQLEEEHRYVIILVSLY